MSDWGVDGDVLGRLEAGKVMPLPATETWSALRSAGGRLAIGDEVDAVSASRWVLTPVIVLGVVNGRVSLWIEASGGNTPPISSGDPRIITFGHIVRDGKWFAFNPEALEAVRVILLAVGAVPGSIDFRQLIGLRKALSDGAPVIDRVGVVSPDLFGPDLASEGEPRGVVATLFPYQSVGWRWLRFLSRHELGGLLADEMGLGKTLQIIALLADPGASPLAPVLIVAPGTLLENWRREFVKFAPGREVLIHQGSDRTGSPAELARHQVVVTSYDTLTRDLGMFGTVVWDAVVLDEAQAIRNPDARRSIAVCGLHRSRSFAMTGTPLENRLLDIWSIMNFVAPGYLGDRRDFERRFGDDEDGARLLEPLITPLMLRRRVREVAKDLPPRIDIDVPLTMPEDAARTYDRLRQEALDEFGAVGAMVAMTKLRQFCGHPTAAGEDWPDAATFPKTARLLQIMEEIADNGEKAIIFCSFLDVSDLVISVLRKKLNLWTDRFDGRVPLADRQGIIDAFSKVKGSACLVLNPKVGGAGVNITAASHVIHYGLEWNPALEAQASARAWRRGQTRPVTVHRMFFADTVEEVMNDRLARKTALGDAAVLGVIGAHEDYEDAMKALSLSPTSGSM